MKDEVHQETVNKIHSGDSAKYGNKLFLKKFLKRSLFLYLGYNLKVFLIKLILLYYGNRLLQSEELQLMVYGH